MSVINLYSTEVLSGHMIWEEKNDTSSLYLEILSERFFSTNELILFGVNRYGNHRLQRIHREEMK